MAAEFKPMRSLIYVNLAKEDYRHKLLHWLHRYHVQDSISQFDPYVSKYAFYQALPVPQDGERFGTVKMQLTEHYWLLNPFTPDTKVKTLTEYFPMDVLKWQGNIPDDNVNDEQLDGDSARSSGGNNGLPPFMFAFVPVWWEEDFKGSNRTVEDGPNYRWQCTIRYPEGVLVEEGDKWLFEEVIPKFKEMPEVTRILTSKIMKEVNNCPYYRVMEMWFDGPSSWHKCAVENTKDIKKPDWASQESFPYLESGFEIQSIFLTDIAYSDNLTQHRGWITMR
ncbi:acetyl-CoA hydrolase [Alkalibacter mobilis]|uniref:acetyl-CoA hydrolase n=1 Tax=Alkalibacter mobilis TaxID=2787712 RepID=UPI00189ECC86|nr:acetyl-CoA hydrolase [Alkalibacter mobilis]MBF7095608.1 acetyl-CoA hydrolase [Alkalibacter mobilis]